LTHARDYNKIDGVNTADNSFDSRKRRMVIALLVIAMLAAVASSFPAVQLRVKETFFKADRVVLAKINTFYGIEQKEYLILKLKDEAGLQIEIYEMDSEGGQTFKQKFELTQDADAYITLDKNTTNLALSDVDKDGVLDILAPSVDRNGNLRLNAFRFNIEFNSFEPLEQK
jgi:hypothetical protein